MKKIYNIKLLIIAGHQFIIFSFTLIYLLRVRGCFGRDNNALTGRVGANGLAASIVTCSLFPFIPSSHLQGEKTWLGDQLHNQWHFHPSVAAPFSCKTNYSSSVYREHLPPEQAQLIHFMYHFGPLMHFSCWQAMMRSFYTHFKSPHLPACPAALPTQALYIYIYTYPLSTSLTHLFLYVFYLNSWEKIFHFFAYTLLKQRCKFTPKLVALLFWCKIRKV